MSTTTDGPRLGDDTAALTARVDALDRALAVGGARLAPSVVARVVATVDSVRERLELGVDHTVVALVGGTGSGKSSLFNAICRLDFADVGVRRPTTSEITACVWGDDGLAAVALAAAAGVRDAHDLLVDLIDTAGERAVEELRDDLVAQVAGQVAVERSAVGDVLADPDLAEDAASRLRLRLAVLKGLT